MGTSIADDIVALHGRGLSVQGIIEATGLSDYRVRSIMEQHGILRTGWKGPRGYADALKRKGQIIALRRLGYDYHGIAERLKVDTISHQTVGRVIRNHAPNLAGLRRRTLDIKLSSTQFAKLREIADRRGESSLPRMIDVLIDENVEPTAVPA